MGEKANKEHKLDLKWVRYHDYWNIILLPIVLIFNVWYCLYPNEETYSKQFVVFLAYIVADALFILIKPDCVGLPRPILVHHVAVIIGWIAVTQLEHGKWFVSACVIVEINTWFKFLKRYCPDNFMLRTIVDILFLTSWVGIRLMLYPYMLFIGIRMYYVPDESIHWTPIELIVHPLCLLVMGVLSYYNAIWTYDLFTKNNYLGFSMNTDLRKVE